MNLSRRVRQAAEAEASKYGASVTFRLGGHHILMELHHGKQRRQTSLSNTNKKKTQQHQEDWVRQYVRRKMKEMQCSTSKPSRPSAG